MDYPVKWFLPSEYADWLGIPKEVPCLEHRRKSGPKKPKRLTDEEKAEMKRLHQEEGWSAYRLAKHFSVAHSTAWKTLRQS